MPQTILDFAESSNKGLDKETTYQSSIDRFTDNILETMSTVVRSNVSNKNEL